ncbi:MAG: GTPase ObgE [Treponema sp.]|jgi:GTP-binding protein|nr:GTPase ObgE [Treponema sp.]
MEKFADEAIIEVSSGSGGNGCAAFRREKYVPRGGPSGGDGGRGGNVVFTVRRNLRTLAHLRYKYSFKAQNGRDGGNAGRYGHNGADVIIPLPPGSLIRDSDTNELIRDFSKKQDDFIFLKGGNGGWGNIHFKSSVNQAPTKALSGKPGITAKLKVELQIMADIGLVGFPNAGKSSLLDRFTNARPKIAAYPFTTKIPNLGVLTIGEKDIIIADIPGLIRGASNGAGLGIRFLKHISRTKILAFLIDLSDDNYLDAFDVLLNELNSFSPRLSDKKRLLVGTKTDLEDDNWSAEGRLSSLAEKYPAEDVLGISVFSGGGIKELSSAFLRLTDTTEDQNELSEDENLFDSTLSDDGGFDFEDDDSLINYSVIASDDTNGGGSKTAAKERTK